MAIGLSNQENSTRSCSFIKTKVAEIAEKTKKIGQDDPRRISHSAKVGLALTLVSFFYYFRPLYDGFGQAGMWAIFTVVVVFEYTVGGTLSKCLNRSVATFLAGALGIGAEYLATLSGEKGEPVLLGILVFILVWAGQDLHNLAAANIEKLASFLEGFGDEFFCFLGDEGSGVASKNDKSFLQEYKSVLNAKATEESLANFAWWEPGHGRFEFHYPWKQYLKIGVLARECACHIEALSGYINSRIQVSSEFYLKIHQPCINISLESSKALRDLAAAIKNMVHPCDAETHVKNSKVAANELKSIIESSSSLAIEDLQEIIPTLVVSSILIDIIKCVEKISESVHKLSKKAHFKKANSTIISEKQQVKQLLRCGIVKPINDANCNHVAIEINGTSEDNSSARPTNKDEAMHI